MKIKKILIMLLLATSIITLSNCRDAQVVSRNLSEAADNFEITRRVVFFNGITDKYLLVVVGRCSIEDRMKVLEVTCKKGPEQFVKHFLGLSDNVSYFSEQVETKNVSTYRYTITFKPSVIIPSIRFK